MELQDETYDEELHIATTGDDASCADAMRFPYEPTPYPVLNRLAQSGCIRKENTLLDYGCGKGRAALFLSHRTGCRAIGIEYDERMYRIAEENRRNANAEATVQFVLADAADYEVPPETDRVFFFNPFSVKLLEAVLEKIRTSVQAAPREILLLFYYPSANYIRCLNKTPDLTYLEEIECDNLFEEVDMKERILVYRMES